MPGRGAPIGAGGQVVSLIAHVQCVMQEDDADMDDQSERLATVWHEADAAGRALLDEAFIALCGYSLNTLINR